MGLLLETKELIERSGLPVENLSGGGTGTYAITGRIPGITEVQAGSYLFLDTKYRGIEGLDDFYCALTVLTTVISHPEKGRVIVDAGRKAVSQDFGLPEVKDSPGAKLTSLAEEHGIIHLEEPNERIAVGDKIELIVSHCCTTINLHDRYFAMRNGCLEAVWPIAARGAFC
jgi:D-serine deaminase-like pyridoxal phosphate-dependent protein